MENESATFWAGIKKFEDILAVDPDALSFAPLADIYRKLGLLDESIAIARRGVARHPDFAAGQLSLATACLEKGLTDEARGALESVVRITPENLDAQKSLAALYTAAGNAAAAAKCLRIVATLAPDADSEIIGGIQPADTAEDAAVFSSGAGGQLAAVAGMDEEEILEADILELTDDLIEEESFTSEPFTPFAAAPSRPSLQAGAIRSVAAVEEKVQAETFAPETASEKGSVSAEGSTFDLEEDSSQSSVMTATIAELYINQGLIDKGIEVYRELLRDNPGNAAYRGRLEELLAPSRVAEAPAGVAASVSPHFTAETEAVPEPIASTKDAVGVLEGWLSNIGRMRGCRTESR